MRATKKLPVNRVTGNGEAIENRQLMITAPKKRTANFKVIGTSPYVQQKFSEKAMKQMIEQQEAGQTAKKGKKREPKDFKAAYEAAQYQPSGEQWPNGAIPATQFKAAMVAACALTGFAKTNARITVKVLADGYDESERKPLVRITKGKPSMFKQALPNANGRYDIRVRPVWEPGWEAIVRIEYDADLFTVEDVANLLSRAGSDVGIGEGRDGSKHCVGQGWGAFTIASEAERLDGKGLRNEAFS
jgi:hypothetical protein